MKNPIMQFIIILFLTVITPSEMTRMVNNEESNNAVLPYYDRPIRNERGLWPSNPQTITMDEYPKSIDDKFNDCKPQMYEKIKSKYLKKELENNKEFKIAWDHAKCELDLHKKKDNKLSEDDLRKIAIRVYTGDEPYKFYDKLNSKMRDGRCDYMTDFGLISLHFLITDAIQTLNPQGKCETTYRFSKDRFEIKGKFVRFGSFASSTRDPTLKTFGRETCFVITTCHGAHIASISAFKNEDEVLIPPYERFIKKKLPASFLKFNKALKDCVKIHKLESKRTVRIMKCDLVNFK